jgi:hypothetical protein
MSGHTSFNWHFRGTTLACTERTGTAASLPSFAVDEVRYDSPYHLESNGSFTPDNAYFREHVIEPAFANIRYSSIAAVLYGSKGPAASVEEGVINEGDCVLWAQYMILTLRKLQQSQPPLNHSMSLQQQESLLSASPPTPQKSHQSQQVSQLDQSMSPALSQTQPSLSPPPPQSHLQQSLVPQARSQPLKNFYVIPSTLPPMYSEPGVPDISHVAVVVCLSNGYVLLDPAFLLKVIHKLNYR